MRVGRRNASKRPSQCRRFNKLIRMLCGERPVAVKVECKITQTLVKLSGRGLLRRSQQPALLGTCDATGWKQHRCLPHCLKYRIPCSLSSRWWRMHCRTAAEIDGKRGPHRALEACWHWIVYSLRVNLLGLSDRITSRTTTMQMGLQEGDLNRLMRC